MARWEGFELPPGCKCVRDRSANCPRICPESARPVGANLKRAPAAQVQVRRRRPDYLRHLIATKPTLSPRRSVSQKGRKQPSAELPRQFSAGEEHIRWRSQETPRSFIACGESAGGRDAHPPMGLLFCTTTFSLGANRTPRPVFRITSLNTVAPTGVVASPQPFYAARTCAPALMRPLSSESRNSRTIPI